MRFFYFVAIAFCVLLAGCDDAVLMKKFTSPEDESVAKHYIELLQQRKFDQIERDLDSSIKDGHTDAMLSQMADLLPDENPVSVKVVGAHTFRDPQTSTVDMTFEYEFPSKWLLVNMVMRTVGGVRTVQGFHVTPIADSLENLNKFTLAGKSALQYFVLLCDVASLLFSFYVFVLCLRSKDMKPKWLWCIIVLTGVGKFAVNWGTGEWTYQIVAFQIPCFSMGHALYGPWIVAAYLPLGAIIFLHRRWKMNTGESIPPTALTERNNTGGNF